jgi:hypothetical protein
MADAADSKSATRKGVKVRLLSPAPFPTILTSVRILIGAPASPREQIFFAFCLPPVIAWHPSRFDLPIPLH